MKKARLINELREHFNLHLSDGCSDEDILMITKGTYGRAICELRLEWRDFIKSIKSILLKGEKE